MSVQSESGRIDYENSDTSPRKKKTRVAEAKQPTETNKATPSTEKVGPPTAEDVGKEFYRKLHGKGKVVFDPAYDAMGIDN